MAKEATLRDKQELMDLVSNRVSEVKLSTGKTVKVGYIVGYTQDVLDDLIVRYETFKKSLKNLTPDKKEPTYSEKDINRGNKETRRFYAKCVAAILLNHPFKIMLLHWIKWRWLYYFGNWNGQDYPNVILEAKKKATEGEYQLAMALLMDMTTTWTTMTKKEAEEYRHELELVKEAQSLKNSQV